MCGDCVTVEDECESVTGSREVVSILGQCFDSGMQDRLRWCFSAGTNRGLLSMGAEEKASIQNIITKAFIARRKEPIDELDRLHEYFVVQQNTQKVPIHRHVLL